MVILGDTKGLWERSLELGICTDMTEFWLELVLGEFVASEHKLGGGGMHKREEPDEIDSWYSIGTNEFLFSFTSVFATQAGVSKTLWFECSSSDGDDELKDSMFSYRHTEDINWNGRSGDCSENSTMSLSGFLFEGLTFIASLSRERAWATLCVKSPPPTFMAEIGGVGMSSNGGGYFEEAGGISWKCQNIYQILQIFLPSIYYLKKT